MTKETTDNFLAVLTNFDWPEPAPVFYRLYHSEDGLPIVYSMEELPHAFVEVDAQTFQLRDMNVRVQDGKVIFIQPNVVVNKLQPSNFGTACHPNDVCVVVSLNQPHQKWALTNHEIN